MKIIPNVLSMLLATTFPLSSVWAQTSPHDDLADDQPPTGAPRATAGPSSWVILHDALSWAVKNPLKAGAISTATAYFFYCVALQGGMRNFAVDLLHKHGSKIADFFGDDAINFTRKGAWAPHLLSGLHKTLFSLGSSVAMEKFFGAFFVKPSAAARGASDKPDIWERTSANAIIKNVGGMTLWQITAASLGLASSSSIFKHMSK